MAKPKPYIVLYEDDRRTIANLSDVEIGRLIRSMFTYRETGTAPEIKGREAIILPTFIARIDRDVEAQAKKSQTLRKNAEKRWHANACICMHLHQKEKEQEKEKVTQKEREEEKDILSTMCVRARKDEAWRHAMYSFAAASMMDREAFDRLADLLSRDDLTHYLEVVDDCQTQGRPFTDPEQAVLNMARKDGKLKGAYI